MVKPNLVVISYDLASNRNRRRLAKMLSGQGVRVQKSVFECALSTTELSALREKIRPLVGPQDSVRYYRLCPSCSRGIAVDGSGFRYLADPVLDV